MKYGSKYRITRDFETTKPTRFCTKCLRQVCLSKYTVKQKGRKRQTKCDYCLGVAVWVEDV